MERAIADADLPDAEIAAAMSDVLARWRGMAPSD
jgi:hypothetical protein